MEETPIVSNLRFALSIAEVENCHRDGVIGPFPLMSPAETDEA